MADNIN